MGCTLQIRYRTDAVLFDRKMKDSYKEYRTKMMARMRVAFIPYNQIKFVKYAIIDDGKKETIYVPDARERMMIRRK